MSVLVTILSVAFLGLGVALLIVAAAQAGAPVGDNSPPAGVLTGDDSPFFRTLGIAGIGLGLGLLLLLLDLLVFGLK